MRSLQALHDRLGRAPRWVSAALAMVLVGVVWIVDAATGSEISSSVLYLAPIFLAAWYAGPRWGFAVSLASAGAWFLADVGAGHIYTAQWIPVWNAAVRLIFFVIITDLLRRLHLALRDQTRLAETDALTGLCNTRRFLAALETEVARASRYGHPLSLAYIDLDGFKEVNDTRGHHVGDTVLETVGHALAAHVRATDLPGRLGGDEFAILLPETDAAQVREAVAKVRMALEAAVGRRDWKVGFSIGVVTALGGGLGAQDLLRVADDLMYRVKKAGTGSVAFGVTGGAGGVRV